MLGFIFILLTYLVVLGSCFLVKKLTLKIKSGKQSKNSASTSKIYYVTNSTPKKKKKAHKKPDIAIKGNLIEKIVDGEDSV